MIPRWAECCLRIGGVFLLSMAFTHAVIAAEEPGRAVVNPIVTLGKLALALTVVLAVFWVFARIMRQFHGIQAGVHQNLKVIAALSVGQRERVLVVQAGDQQLVLGVTSTQINTLHVLEKPLTSQAPETQQNEFKTKLSAALKRRIDP